MERSRTTPDSRKESEAAWRISVLLLVLILAVIAWGTLRNTRRPLKYRIGVVDQRFGMDHQRFSAAVRRAATIWSSAAGRELFREDPESGIEVSLVYDYRQETIDRMKSLSLKIGTSKENYEELRGRFEDLKGETEGKLRDLESNLAAYNARVQAFNAEMDAARRRGGATETEHRRMVSEREVLKTQQEDLRKRQSEMKESDESLRALGSIVNDMAMRHNLELVNYRNTGSTLGEEFSEGQYVMENGRRTITIYHFPSEKGLVRVLAHEFGHALGMKHAVDPKAIMHRLILSDSLEPAPEDLSALRENLRR